MIGLGFSIWLFVAVGMDSANKLAGIFSFFIGAIALAATVYGLVTARRGPANKVSQAVSDSAIGGGVLQVSGVRNKVSLRRTAGSPGVAPTPGAVPTATSASPAEGQSVTHSRVAGPVEQLHDIGELDADR